jgi:hypothetical protein
VEAQAAVLRNAGRSLGVVVAGCRLDAVCRELPAKQSFACIAVATLPLGHAVAAATWAKASALARERDEAVITAIIAVKAQESMGENPAAQEGLEFVLDDGVEDFLFGAMSCVGTLPSSALRVRRMWSTGLT